MRILFATVSGDGHFNPLTGISVHLKDIGDDVRWYRGRDFAARLERLGIPHIPFKRAQDIRVEDVSSPERARLHGLALMRYDLERFFIANVDACFQDIREIDSSFPFDVLVCDGGFMAATLVKEKLGKHLCVVGLGDSFDLSKDSPPRMTGWKPARTPIGRLAYRFMRAAMEWLVMGGGKASYNRVLAAHGLAQIVGPMFSEGTRGADIVFASGVPGFVYPARQPNPKVRFVGALRPARPVVERPFPSPEKLADFERIVFVSQGTVDNRDLTKLIVPALEALKDTEALIVVTTGGSGTEALRRSYPRDNVIIEDWVDYDFMLDHTDLFITNGGAGGVLLSLSKGVPVLGAGVREGKNAVNARLDYFRAGIDLHTERPTPNAIRRAADRLLNEPEWKRNTKRLRDEFSAYRPYEVIDAYLASLDGAAQHPAAHAQKGGLA